MSRPAERGGDLVEVTAEVLAALAVPRPSVDAAKGDRGQVLIVGGSAETAGAVLLAGVAALRVGAGKLQIATTGSAVPALMAAVPEARVVRLPETADGAIDPRGAADRLAALAAEADAVLIGTGTMHPAATAELLDHFVPLITRAPVIVDANAIPALVARPEWLAAVRGRLVVMPNPGELSALGAEGGDRAGLRALAVDLAAVIAARAADTLITDGAEADGPVYIDGRGHVALATSGSGDVAAGIIAGFAARGASPLAAAINGVHLHGRAGERAAARHGGIGALARDLLEELPGLLAQLP